MSKRFFITTPIYYVNDKPHIGHSYTTIVGDVLARFHRINGEETFYLTGTDEHGAKVAEEAKAQGKTPQELCDQNSLLYKSAWEKLNISYDYFVRTTDKRHEKAVEKLLQEMNAAKVKGKPVVYQGEYAGLYCIGCEKFLTEKELADGKCPNHLTLPQKITEKNYFFRLSEFLPQVEQLISTDKIKIIPEERKTETLGLFKQGLEDFSISREKVTWGIPLPFDSKQIAYVWVDALPNYISAIGYGDNPKEFKKWWTDAEVIHLTGKDILKFHNIFWPAMLLSVGVKVPDVVVNHGFFTVKGQKMSKSLGNVIDPHWLVNQFGADAARYLLLTQFPFGIDGDIQADRFVEKFNSELANDLGNLVSRVVKMIADYCGGTIPEAKKYDKSDEEIKALAVQTPVKVMDLIYQIKVTSAIDEVFKLVKKANQYVEASAPWNLAKNKENDKLNTKLYVSAEALRIISALVYPVMPNKAVQIRKILGFGEKELTPSSVKAKKWGVLKAGQKLGKIEPLFPRKEKEPKKVEAIVEDNLIGIEDFGRVQLKVAEVMQAEKVAGADKLLLLKVKVGEREKQIVAGIAQHYQPQDLIGRKIIVVDNLKPATLRGMKSEGMLLAAQDGKSLVLLTVDKDIGAGAKIS